MRTITKNLLPLLILTNALFAMDSQKTEQHEYDISLLCPEDRIFIAQLSAQIAEKNGIIKLQEEIITQKKKELVNNNPLNNPHKPKADTSAEPTQIAEELARLESEEQALICKLKELFKDVDPEDFFRQLEEDIKNELPK